MTDTASAHDTHIFGNTGRITIANLPTREQQAHKLWAESCQELQALEKQLAPAFARHQKALDECAVYGSENRLRMNPYMTEAFSKWQAQRVAEQERTRQR